MTSRPEDICLKCGLCCNGVIFADGQLEPSESAEKIRALGLTMKRGTKFRQPCTAFAHCKCRVYAERPNHCRNFECLLLKRYASGEVTPDAALRTIKTARKRAAEVEQLLMALGNREAHLPLRTRFRRLNQQIAQQEIDSEKAGTFGDLTIAVHDLNVTLSRDFYPG